jgi:glycerophosphoryl diester phosphodiesterase
MAWVQPPENTHASLVKAMNNLDGVEFDLRLTADNQLVIHHDHEVSIPKELLEGRPKIAEQWSLAELEEVGFCSFEKLMADKEWLVPWQEHSKAACLEIKRSNPSITPDSTERMAEIMAQATAMLDEAGIPNTSAVFYAFHRPMAKVAKISKTTRPWSRLLPIVPRRGSHYKMRMMAAPEFFAYSFGRLMRSQKKAGAPMMPCTSDYFEGFTRFTHFGFPVGLKGRGRKRLDKIRGDFPVYIWPGHLHLERDLINAGLSVLTDNADPEQLLPDGSSRWLRPATMPLSKEQWDGLKKGIIPEDITPYHELNDEPLPWNVTRMIGHRGCGKTPRPVLQM